MLEGGGGGERQVGLAAGGLVGVVCVVVPLVACGDVAVACDCVPLGAHAAKNRVKQTNAPNKAVRVARLKGCSATLSLNANRVRDIDTLPFSDESARSARARVNGLQSCGRVKLFDDAS